MKKRFNLIKTIIASNFRRLSFPYKATFALTYKCNLRCKICNIWNRPGLEELGIGEIEKIFKKLPGLIWLDLTGGEITLREDLLEVIKIIIKNAKKLSIFHISSNGQLPDKVILAVREILKSNVMPIVNVSVDGPGKVNDELRGGIGTYAKSVETFSHLKRLRRGRCYLSCTISDYNIDHIEELFVELGRDVASFSRSDIHFNIFHKSQHYYNNQDIEGLRDLDSERLKACLSFRNDIKLFRKIAEKKYIKGMLRYLAGKGRMIKCQALNSSCFISPDGLVYPCLVYDKVIGSLRDQGYNMELIWNNPAAVMLKKEIKDGSCPSCWGGCEVFSSMLGDIVGSLTM